ncbi:unnamed protein product [Paramecium primaurelia]|uniref:Uncharacterized protein n=1 Tax=Paramecium primaurelia TaxID=5886 RepID=A0A8S1P1K6_PARPR|nr:unnamed protein product [Paramecium primaurelia]
MTVFQHLICSQQQQAIKQVVIPKEKFQLKKGSNQTQNCIACANSI